MPLRAWTGLKRTGPASEHPPWREENRPRVYRLARRRGVGYAAEHVPRDVLIRLIDFPELPLRIHVRDTIKAGRSALLVRGEIPMGGKMVAVAYKRVRRRNLLKALSAWLRGNRSLKTWRMALRFARLGLPTARPLLLVVPRWYQPWRASFLAMEWLDQARNLTVYSEWLAQQPARAQRPRRAAAAESLGRVLGEMHSAKISHRDLKAGNLLLVNRASSVEAFIIDLDGADQRFWLSRRRRWRDLSRLAHALRADPHVTHALCLRFLRAYLQHSGSTGNDWKTCWRQLSALTDRRHRQRHRKRGQVFG